ncbi:capsid protein [Sutcliffiella cohnii]|uniref:Capsid protein n=1 Tax=Sutcliffiella cohnii TaxID=33932 RepID=A0A223KU83_9BACI|nr:capsid protein [Sutcliffiella cohnii]AST93006.1 capsid protein [Sutcliffiella cohnii]
MNEFPLNYKNKYSINITPEGAEPTWAPIGAGISSVDPSFDDETDDTAYYDGEGFSSETVTGIKATLTFTGHRKYGDEAQDYIASLAFEVGAKRETELKWEQPDGRVITGPVTISGIKTTGGDANSKSEFEFTATFNGKPQLTN